MVTTPPPIRCVGLPPIPNGWVDNGSDEAGSARKIVCNSGYYLQGENQIFCQETGIWSSFTGSCTINTTPLPLQCSNVPTIRNGRASTGSSDIGSSRYIACISGYQLQGSNQMTCERNGIWNTTGICNPTTQARGSSRIRELQLMGSYSGHDGEGYILIRQHDGQWGSICDHNFGFKEAEVVCNILGYE